MFVLNNHCCKRMLVWLCFPGIKKKDEEERGTVVKKRESGRGNLNPSVIRGETRAEKREGYWVTRWGDKLPIKQTCNKNLGDNGS